MDKQDHAASVFLPKAYADNPTIEYSTAQDLMKYGADALHDHVSTRVEAALGRALPQMEVRFKNLSITADVIVSNNQSEEILPTLTNEVLKGFSGLSAKKHKETKHILKNVNGVFKPGTMTLVLGQPGSGKSSLMKILSGRFPLGKNCKLEGEIQYNGADQKDVAKCLPQFASYVTQRDFHFPALSVKETLEFAHECCGGELSKHAEDAFTNGSADENCEAMQAAKAWVKHYPEIIIQQLGLENCQDTVVGDAMLRGVSGGERKRVTTGEMQFGNKTVVFMDEISTGLDSAAAYDIIKTQRSLAQKLRKTVVIALLQPSPEIFALFDYVMILNEGHVIYHGPQEHALGLFESMGFVRSPERDVADFLLDIGTPQQHRYETGRPAGAKYPRTASELADLYEKSAVHEMMLKQLHGPHDDHLIHDREDYFDNVPEFHQSFWESTMTVTRRQLKLTTRDTAFLASRAVMIIVLGLLNGSVFWQVDPKEVQIVNGVLFQTVLFLCLGQFAQIPTFFASRGIFYKQRGANFYRTSSYVLAFSVCQIPQAITESLVFGSMIYWMCGLVPSISSFVVFELLLLLTMLAFTAMFFFFSCATPNLNIAQPVAMVVLTFIILYGGFALSESQMQDWLVWIYWIDPVTWCLRALAINQYGSDEFNVPVYDGIDYMGQFGMTMGKYSLELVGFKTETYWVYLAFVFIGAVYVMFMVLSYVALEYFRFEQPENSGLGGGEDEDTLSSSTSPNSSDGSEYALSRTPRGDSNGDIIMEVKPPSRKHKSTPVTLAFTDLWYTVPDPQNPNEGLDLLKGISGYALPGTITALMGSSGAGKTTLMDVIAGRKTGGKIQGQILLNGYEATPLAIQRSTGYCEQMDIHSEASTFREALTFSAFLRQGQDVPDSEKYDSVEECLDLLDLRPIADKIIRGSSVEQMKRLTIGVELAAQPSVLFLDEPTSGLDARSAKMIMGSVRKVANTGRTVVCTIHQPSAEVFRVFDSLLLLKRGGYTVYFGELGHEASELVSYLESVDGVTPLEEGYNPATWMLEAIGAGVGNTAGNTTDFVEIYNQSVKKVTMMEYLNRGGVARPAAGMAALSFQDKRAASNATQAKFLIKRFFDLYWRTASYNLTRIGVFAMLGLVFGASYASVDYTTYQGINGGVAMIFITTFFSGIISFNSVIPMIGQDRGAFYRERASQTYNALWYFVAGLLAEIPYVFGSTFIYTAAFFPLVGFTGVAEFFFYWLNVAMFVLMMTYAGMFLAFALPTVEVATIVGVIVNSIYGLFVGFNPPASAIPQAYKWLYQITPHRYTLEALATIVFGNCKSDKPGSLACAKLQNAPPTVSPNVTIAEFIGVVYGMHYDSVWRDVFVILGCSVVFSVLALVSLRYINHQKRFVFSTGCPTTSVHRAAPRLSLVAQQTSQVAAMREAMDLLRLAVILDHGVLRRLVEQKWMSIETKPTNAKPCGSGVRTIRFQVVHHGLDVQRLPVVLDTILGTGEVVGAKPPAATTVSPYQAARHSLMQQIMERGLHARLSEPMLVTGCICAGVAMSQTKPQADHQQALVTWLAETTPLRTHRFFQQLTTLSEYLRAVCQVAATTGTTSVGLVEVERFQIHLSMPLPITSRVVRAAETLMETAGISDVLLFRSVMLDPHMVSCDATDLATFVRVLSRDSPGLTATTGFAHNDTRDCCDDGDLSLLVVALMRAIRSCPCLEVVDLGPLLRLSQQPHNQKWFWRAVLEELLSPAHSAPIQRLCI